MKGLTRWMKGLIKMDERFDKDGRGSVGLKATFRRLRKILVSWKEEFSPLKIF